ncbi:MAG: TetR/AcrR family transcriptional regulator [Methylococcales bacterium]|nr:TetR/AcrR family transcriptional regulator [Methylococcales bacterium]
MARTIEFDRVEVLQKAMEVFWNEGYSKTSISSLVIATNLKPGSIYAAFNSKEGLFLAALNYYGERSVDTLNTLINEAESPLQGIKAFILKQINGIRDKTNQKGCFLINTVLEATSDEIAIKDEIKKNLSVIESILLSALLLSQKEGELPENQNPRDLVKFLMINLWGLQVLAKTNPDEETIDAVEKQLFLNLGI